MERINMIACQNLKENIIITLGITVGVILIVLIVKKLVK